MDDNLPRWIRTSYITSNPFELGIWQNKEHLRGRLSLCTSFHKASNTLSDSAHMYFLNRNKLIVATMYVSLWWRHPLVTGGFPSQRPVMWSFDVSFDVSLNKLLSKQFRCRWFETPLRLLQRQLMTGMISFVCITDLRLWCLGANSHENTEFDFSTVLWK